MNPSLAKGFWATEAARSMAWNIRRLFTTAKMAFCRAGWPCSTASRRRSSRISSGMSIMPGQTSLQLPHWMHRPWMSSDFFSSSNQAVRMVPMPPV